MESSGPAAGTVSPASASGAVRWVLSLRPSRRPCRAVPGLPRHPRPSGPELRRAQCPALTSQSPHDPGSCSKLGGQRGEAVSPPRLGAGAPPLPYLREGAGAGPWSGRDLFGAGLLGVWAVFQRGVVGPLLLPWRATWALLDSLLH